MSKKGNCRNRSTVRSDKSSPMKRNAHSFIFPLAFIRLSDHRIPLNSLQIDKPVATFHCKNKSMINTPVSAPRIIGHPNAGQHWDSMPLGPAQYVKICRMNERYHLKCKSFHSNHQQQQMILNHCWWQFHVKTTCFLMTTQNIFCSRV